ncbi:MAG: PEP-CTERM sorting domain-containing protein [Pseudomonadales bacterium]
MKWNKYLSVTVLTSGFLLSSMSAQANVLTYDTWTTNSGDSPNYIFTIDDSTAGKFNYNLTIDPWNAEALGLFVDFGNEDVGNAAAVGLVDTTVIVPGGSGVSLFATDTSSNNCGGGCTLSGLNPSLIAPDGEWELVFRLGDSGYQGQQTFSWVTNSFGLGLSDFGLVGVRSQVFCTGTDLLPGDQSSCDGSDKSYSSTPSTPPPNNSVPEPSTLLLFCFGLAGLVYSRRQVLKV